MKPPAETSGRRRLGAAVLVLTLAAGVAGAALCCAGAPGCSGTGTIYAVGAAPEWQLLCPGLWEVQARREGTLLLCSTHPLDRRWMVIRPSAEGFSAQPVAVEYVPLRLSSRDCNSTLALVRCRIGGTLLVSPPQPGPLSLIPAATSVLPFALSPDGHTVAVSDLGCSGVWVADMAQERPQAVLVSPETWNGLDRAQAAARYPPGPHETTIAWAKVLRWSADGRYIYYASQRGGREGQFYRLSPDGAGEEAISRCEAAWGVETRSGRFFASGSDDRLILLDPATGEAEDLGARLGVLGFPGDCHETFLSPDRTILAYEELTAVHFIREDGRAWSLVFPPGIRMSGGAGAWSPDGRLYLRRVAAVPQGVTRLGGRVRDWPVMLYVIEAGEPATLAWAITEPPGRYLRPWLWHSGRPAWLDEKTVLAQFTRVPLPAKDLLAPEPPPGLGAETWVYRLPGPPE